MSESLSVPQSHVPISRQNKRGLAHSLVNLAQARWAKLSRAVKGIARAMFLAKEDKEAFKAESEQALSAALAGVSEVKLHVEDVRDLQKINYLHQGNADLYTEEAVKQRHDLRTDGGLMEAVRAWWRYLPKDETAKLPQVTKPVYCAMVVIIQMVLLPRFKMKGDINYDPEEDWLDDNKGQDSMGFPDFFDAMFELADMWCESMSASDYTALLSQLLSDAKAQGNMFDMLLKKFGYVVPDVAPDVGAVDSDEVATSTSDRHKAADGSASGHDSVKESNNSKDMKSKEAGGGAKIMEGGGGDHKGQGVQGINGKNKGRKTKTVHMGDISDGAALVNVSQSGTSRDEGEDLLGDLNSTLGFAADHGARHAMIPGEDGDSGVHIEELEASSNHPSHSGVLEQATSLRPRHSLPPLQSDDRRKDSHRNRQAPHVLRAGVREKEEDPSEFQSHGRGMPPTSMGMKGPGIVNIDFKDPKEHAPEIPLWYENSRKQARLRHSQADASDSHNGQQRKQQLQPLTDLPGQQYISTRVKNYVDNNLPELSQLAPSAPFVPAAVKLSASPQKQRETAFGAINGSPQRPRGLCKGLASARPSSWSFEGSPGKPPWVNAGNRVTQSQEPVSLFVPSRPVRQLPPMPIRELSESPTPQQSLQQAPKSHLPQHLAKLPKLGHPIGQAAALPKTKEYAAPLSRKVMLPGLRQYPGGSLGLPLVDGSGFSGPTFVPPPHVDTDSSGISEREMSLIPQVESIS